MKSCHDNIPKSNLTGYNTVVGDLSTPEGKATALFLNPHCVVFGVNEIIHTVYITPYFDWKLLPAPLDLEIFRAKRLIIQSTFSTDVSRQKLNYALPNWLANFSNLNELHIKSADLSNLNSFTTLPVEHLMLREVYYSDEQNLIIDILCFKCLKELTYDESLTENIIKAIGTRNITLIAYHEEN